MTVGIIERYAAYLPVTPTTPRITLGEGSTPLVRSSRIGPAIGLDQLYFKCEGLNPSGSFKDRGMALATARAIEAGAHAYAARAGRYGPLALWKVEGTALVGTLELPLAVGIVGDRIRLNPRAQLSLRVLSVQSARELALVMAAVGLGQNFAALRALATEGIQRGHMELHGRGASNGSSNGSGVSDRPRLSA